MRRHLQRFALALITATAIVGCHKKQPEKKKSSTRQRQDAILRANDEQQALNAFTGAIREAVRGWQTQPISGDAERQQTIRTLAGKLEKVPVKGLPEDLSKAWIEMLDAWSALAKNPAPDAVLARRGSKAAEELNRQLAARGVMDLRF